jgi:hypothetical protein
VGAPAGAHAADVRRLLLSAVAGRTWLALAALLVALTAVPAPAAERDLLLLARGTAGVEVTLRAPAELDLPAMTFRTSGQVAGLAVLDARGELVALSVNVRRWVEGAARPPAPVTTAAGPVRLAQGRYRLVVVTDGPADVRVRVPATGGLARTLRARHRVPAGAELVDLRDVPVGEHVRRPVGLRRGGALVGVLHERSTAHVASLPEVCFAAPGAPDCSASDGASAVLVGTTEPADGFSRLAVFLYGDAGVPSRYDALARAPAVDVPRAVDVLLVRV